MNFDPNNPVIKLCVQGMEMENANKPGQAKDLYLQAWEKAANDFEKFTAAHYLARHQESVLEKLNWDQKALDFAMKIEEVSMKTNFPSLYLNIGKCHEDLGDNIKALENYQAGLSFINYLPDNSYGRMISSGIKQGLLRVSK